MMTTPFDCPGEWLGPGMSCQDCQGPIGPCCIGAGECMMLTMRECMARGGMSIAACGAAECPGGAQTNPILPWPQWNCPVPADCPSSAVFDLGGPSGNWFHPNVAYGYMFNMKEPNDALFTKILDFPTGFDAPFTIDVNGVPLGSFGPGEPVDFVALLGGGVKTFRLTGVSPLTDPESGTIFPIKLEFNVSNAQFHMMPLMTVDMDRNNKVNLNDYSQFAIEWNSGNCTAPDWCGGADFDRNGNVDLDDMVIFAYYWLWQLEL